MTWTARRRSASGLLLALVLVVSACGGTTPASGSASGTPATGAASGAAGSPSAEPSAASSAPPSGGALTYGVQDSEIAWLDPAEAYDVTSAPAVRLMFETLVGYDSGTNLVPVLATEMPTVSADGMTYTFKLRTGVKFVKPDGTVLREMTADDVVYSLNRILDPTLKPAPSPVGGAFFSVIEGGQDVLDGKTKTASGIKAVDPSTVEVKIVKPDRTFLYILAMTFGSVVPKELAGQDATAFSGSPVGTGPYLLKEYAKGEKAVFTRNPAYWGRPGEADTIEFRLNLDPTTELQQVEAGQLDLMGYDIEPGQYAATVNDPRFKDQVVRNADVATNYLSIDTSGPNKGLADVKVRQAMNYAIDKENLKKLRNGRGVVADCIFPTNLPGFDPACKPYTYDVERAKALMKEAGFDAGFKTKLYYIESEIAKVAAQAMQADLAKIGIDAELVGQDFDTLLGTIAKPHAAPLVFIGWYQDWPDPADFIDPILSCGTAVENGANISWYCNKEVDALAAAARGEPDDTKRLAAYKDIQARIMADAPWIPTDHPEFVILRGKRVPDFKLHPVWRFDLANVVVKP